jgi:uncharacterized protein (TIGR02145 family)
MSLVYFDNNVVTINGGMIKSVIARAVDPPYNVIGGREYSTVIIGGKEWLAENLDFKFDGLVVGEGTSTSEPRANYYDNDETTYGVNGNKYGLLYNWNAVEYLENNKSVLIPGWHVSTKDEWADLATAVGGSNIAGTKLKSTTGWTSGNGDGSYDFNAFPAGGVTPDGSFSDVSRYANFWTSNSDADLVYMRYFGTGASMNTVRTWKNRSYSVRLVRDS